MKTINSTLVIRVIIGIGAVWILYTAFIML